MSSRQKNFNESEIEKNFYESWRSCQFDWEAFCRFLIVRMEAVDLEIADILSSVPSNKYRFIVNEAINILVVNDDATLESTANQLASFGVKSYMVDFFHASLLVSVSVFDVNYRAETKFCWSEMLGPAKEVLKKYLEELS